jgi:hypothetical protein
MKIRSILISGALALGVVSSSVAGAGAASAHVPPVPKAIGSVALAGPVKHPSLGPIQYASFFVYAGPGRYHGRIDYANFTQPAFHTNVWNISKANALVFTASGSSYAHTMKVTTITPLSTHSTNFLGTGYYNADNNVTWTISGTVNWNAVSFSIAYTGSSYTVSGHGWIMPGGSVSGIARDSNGLTLTFTMPRDSAFQVLRYTAPVKSAFIWGHNAIFWYTVPRYGMPPRLAGRYVVVKVHDGGPGYKADSYASGYGTFWYFWPMIQYQITSGNILVGH